MIFSFLLKIHYIHKHLNQNLNNIKQLISNIEILITYIVFVINIESKQ